MFSRKDFVLLMFHCKHGSIKKHLQNIQRDYPIAVNIHDINTYTPFCLDCLAPMKLTGYERIEDN